MIARGTFRLSFPVAVCAVVLATALPHAAASSRAITDAEDFTGRLDIVGALHGHRSAAAGESRRVKHTITSARGWRKRAIRCGMTGCDAYFSVRFDVDSDRGYDRVLYLFSRRGKLRGEMFRHDRAWDCQMPRVVCGRKHFVRRVLVWKPNRRSIAARFRTSLLDDRQHSYRWRADVTTGLRSHCRGDVERHIEGGGMVCTDRAPRRKYIRHRL